MHFYTAAALLRGNMTGAGGRIPQTLLVTLSNDVQDWAPQMATLCIIQSASDVCARHQCSSQAKSHVAYASLPQIAAATLDVTRAIVIHRSPYLGW
jgi:hypothetical protein